MTVRSSAATYHADGSITAETVYNSVTVEVSDGKRFAIPTQRRLTFKTQPVPRRIGLMLVGIGGNNGTTVVAGVLANRKNLTWRTKEGVQTTNWYGSFLLSSTCKLGLDSKTGQFVSVPLSDLVPLLKPEELEISGWDYNKMPLGDAMARAKVLDIQVQEALHDEMNRIVPLPACYDADFVASNQADRANNVISGTKQDCLDQLRKDISVFKSSRKLDKVIVLWTGTTERFCDETVGVHDTAANLLSSIAANHTEVSPSTIYGAAAVLEGCTFINGSPQNTCVAGLAELARQNGAFLGGDDFKSGQTKFKSVLTDFLISSGLKVTSIVSYNHLGNNDGLNLSSYKQFRSKEISKSNVVDDMVNENRILYPRASDSPDHCVVIKYVAGLGDSKRALDEYTSEIFMGGKNTIVVHNTCEDSLLAAPIIIDLVILSEFCTRVSVKEEGSATEEAMDTILSLLSFLCKAPLVPHNAPVVNALNSQRQAIINVFRACIGLPADNPLCLEHRLPSLLSKYN